MQELYHNLFVGSLEEYEAIKDSIDMKESFVVHAAKEPYHRQFVGYTGRACDKDHPEYLKATRGHETAVNLVDAQESKYFNADLIKDLVGNIITVLNLGKKVYIHCNQGESRAPSIAMLVLLGIKNIDDDYELAQRQIRLIYPKYNPGKGMEDFIREQWDAYVSYFSLLPDGTVEAKVEDVIEAQFEATEGETLYIKE